MILTLGCLNINEFKAYNNINVALAMRNNTNINGLKKCILSNLQHGKTNICLSTLTH